MAEVNGACADTDLRRFASGIWERLPDPSSEPLPATELADILRRCYEAGPKERVLLDTVHKHLLQRTIAHARANSAYYATPSYAEWIETDLLAPADLSCWPVLRRADVVANGPALLASDAVFGALSHTEGTSGRPLHVYRSRAELSYTFDYARTLIAPAIKSLASRPLILSFGNQFHGDTVAMPSPGKALPAAVTDNNLISNAEATLLAPPVVPGHDSRISVISGLLFHLYFFTSYLIERGVDLPALEISGMVVTGSYAPPAMRRFLADAWNTQLFDRFSLTESAGGATRCGACGYFHFDPNVFAEAIEVGTGHSLDEGIGELALTQFQPFASMQPMIRYITGDLVRRVASSCRNGFTFEFLGRTSNCISREIGGSTQWLLLYRDYFDLLCELPDVALTPWFSNVTAALDRSAGSRPIQRAETIDRDGHVTLRFTIELRYAPHCFPDRCAELRRLVSTRLSDASPALRMLIAEGGADIDVIFVGPGGLKGTSTLYV